MDEQDPTAPAEDTATPAETPVAPEAAPATPEAEPVTEESVAPVDAPVEEGPVMDDPRAGTARVVEEEASSPESGVIKDEYMVQ